MCKDNKEKVCAYCGSTEKLRFNKKFNSYFCSTHYNQIHNHGHCIKSLPKLNEYGFVNDNIAYIIIYRNYFSDNCEAYEVFFDAKDIDKVLTHRWNLSNANGYARSNKLFLHRFILDVENKDVCVDHINHNTLDNRRCNLRIATKQQNQWNISKHKDSMNRFKNVCKTSYGWVAQGIANGEKDYIGAYKTELEAAYAYNIWASQKYGEFACLNEFTEQETEELNAYLSVRPIKILNKRKRLSKYKHITRQSSKNNLWEYKRNINGIRYRESGFKTEEEAHDAYIERMKEIGVEP